MRLSSALAAIAAISCVTSAAQASDLSGTSWTLDDAPNVEISFTKDGISGNSGCNRFFGAVTLAKDGAITVGPLAATKMACAGDAAEIEETVLAGLEQATAYQIQDRTITLYDSGENLLLTLTMAE